MCYVVVLTAARWCYSAGAAFVDDVKIASPATKTNSENYISMTSRQGFDQVNELSLLIFTYVRVERVLNTILFSLFPGFIQ